MLNYGGYAQAYFKYDDTPAANADLTEEERGAIDGVTADDLEGYAMSIEGEEEGLSYVGSSLTLKSETTIKHYFTVEDGHDISEYTFSIEGKGTEARRSGSMYYIEIPNIASGNLDRMYEAEAGDMTIRYSALSYAKRMMDTSEDESLIRLLKALYLYNQEANTYFGQ